MKKIMFTILMILATTFVYGMEQDYSGKILIEKLKVLRMIETLKKHNEIVPTVMANVVGADETLKRVANLNEELKVDTLILVFPDANEVKKYLSDVSKKVKNVVIIFIEQQTEDKNLADRTFNKFIEIGGVPVVEKLKNVKVYEVNIEKDDLEKVFENSLKKPFFEDEINQKYILTIYGN